MTYGPAERKQKAELIRSLTAVLWNHSTHEQQHNDFLVILTEDYFDLCEMADDLRKLAYANGLEADADLILNTFHNIKETTP